MSSPIKKAWREAATLIVAAKSTMSTTGYDYKILCMKRSEKTSFLANNISFPGGAVEKQDESLEWLKHLNRFGVTEKELNFLKHPGLTPFIFQEQNRKNVLPRNLSLRISALRETFEELGVLLHTLQPTTVRNHSKYYRGLDIKTCQKQVHSRNITFLDLCKEFNLVPDIFNIYEWSAWLTPTFMANRRFETAFYLCTLNDQPPVHPESIEAQSFMWRTPEEYLQMLANDEIWYHPPQLYEFSRLLNFKKIDELVGFAEEREKYGLTLFMPVVFNCTNGLVMTLPEDNVYPNEPNYEQKSELDESSTGCTMEEFRLKSKNLNRIEMTAAHDAKVYCNTEQPNGHKRPLIVSTSSIKEESITVNQSKL